jgi:hypothetical protein
LLLVDVVAARQQCQEVLLKFVDGARAAQMHKLAEGVAPHWGAKAFFDAVDEVRPGRLSLVLLQAKIPLARGAFEVKGRCPDVLRRRRTLGAKILLALVKPA